MISVLRFACIYCLQAEKQRASSATAKPSIVTTWLVRPGRRQARWQGGEASLPSVCWRTSPSGVPNWETTGQSGALSLVTEIYPAFSLVREIYPAFSLVKSFTVLKYLKYFHSVAPPAFLCHKEPEKGIIGVVSMHIKNLLGAHLIDYSVHRSNPSLCHRESAKSKKCDSRTYNDAPLCRGEW